MTIYVLDTSVLLALGAKALGAFPGQEVVIPLAVLREIENKRNDPNLGMTARQVLRKLDLLQNEGELRTGVKLGDSTVRVEINHVDSSDLPATVQRDTTTDTRILAVAKSLKATLVTKDVPLRILGNVVGVPSIEPPALERIASDVGDVPTIHVDDAIIEELYDKGSVKLDHEIPINTAAVLKSHDESSSAVVIQERGWSVRLLRSKAISGVEGHSLEQRVAIDLLTDPDIPIVSLMGAAGTGKTMLSLAAGLSLVEDKDSPINRVVVFRPLHPVGGKSLGYLPGDHDEKMKVWADAIMDACEAFMNRSKVERLIKEEKLVVLPVEHIRGRTFANAFCIWDESQNHPLDVLLAGITRLGRGSKIALTADPAQVDNLYDKNAEGIRTVNSRLHGEKLFGAITLKKSERSAAAELAARLLSGPVD